MNNKIFLKIGWLLILSLLGYLFFVVTFLSPKVNSYLMDTQIKSERIQFDKIITFIERKAKIYEHTDSNAKEDNREKLLKELRFLFDSINLAKTGHIYIIDSKGAVVLDQNSEFREKNISKIKIPNTNELLINKIKKTHQTKSTLEYKWNKIYDPYNYIYDKISWVEYNKYFDWYIVSSIYTDDFVAYIDGINSLILNISILLFILLAIIGIFITVKVVAPINKMYSEVQKAQDEMTLGEGEKSKDEIGFLANQFNTLLDQVENNRKTLEEHVQQKTKEIRNKLYFDDVTNLRNRQALLDDTKDEEFLSITLVDIDSFDDINELYGFSTGNLVLIEVANILKEFCKKYSVSIYRIYGNVFGLSDKKMIGFSKYDDFINDLSTLFKNRPIHINELDIDIFIDITLGISIAQEDPLKSAGIALKKAKKNNLPFFVYNNEIDTKEIIKKSMFWREKIKLAIQDSRVVPFFQPIYNRNKEIVKYETLMRIEEKDENGEIKYILPGEFFDVAIKTKQYLQLSNQVISKALDSLYSTTKQVSINLSFKDILDREFIYFLDRNLDKIDKDTKSRIVFEILESDYISDYSLLEEFILKYRRLGVKIAIDDFGTGYSNFAHILKIRPDYIKIDGSLIKNINDDKNSFEMVKSIIDFSKALNIKVIAEYIHNEEVFETVKNLEVDEFQGYFLGKPQDKFD